MVEFETVKCQTKDIINIKKFYNMPRGRFTCPKMAPHSEK